MKIINQIFHSFILTTEFGIWLKWTFGDCCQSEVEWNSDYHLMVPMKWYAFAVLPFDNDEGHADTTDFFNLDNKHLFSNAWSNRYRNRSRFVTGYDVLDESFDELEVLYYRKTSSDDWVFFNDIDNIIPIDGSYPDNMTYEWDTESVADLRL